MRGDLSPRAGNGYPMLSATRFGADPDFRALLLRHGLDSFERLMAAGLGQRVARKRQHEMRRIELATEDGGVLACYLRRSFGDSPGAVVKALLRGRMPHAACMREYLMIRELARFDLPVMRPLAWGERYVRGLPRESALLVEAVPGQSASKLLADGDRAQADRVLCAAAALAGRLNRAGFFQPLRLRDMVCKIDSADDGGTLELTLIDRETTLARRRKPKPARCADFLARSYCKLLQAGFEPDLRQTLTCLGEYQAAMRSASTRSSRQLYEDAARHFLRLTGPGKKYSSLRRGPAEPHDQQ